MRDSPSPAGKTQEQGVQGTKWTPGPWYVKYCGSQPLGSACRISSDASCSDSYEGVCYDGSRDECGHMMSEDDARLMAAAPDEDAANLNAVERLEYYVNNPSAWDHFSQNVSDAIAAVVKQSRAALAKARGEGPDA